MHIDLDAFFVSVEQVDAPSLKGKPVVVGGKPEGRGVVAAASYEARKFGLHSGIPLVTASRLCPQAIFIQGSFPKYREASRKFMAILADFSPYLEPMGLDEAYLDVTGFESLHGSIEEMARAIKRRVNRELGINASIGIAGGKIVAKVASEMSKPDGLLEVKEGEDAAFLAPLPVGKLPGIGQKTAPKLKSLGIDTIGKLSAAPPEALKSHFGASGEVLKRFAGGIDDREVEPPAAAKSTSRETTFERDSKDAALLESTLRYLGEKVGADLRRHNKRARCVTLKLRYGDFTTITRRTTLNQSTDSDRLIFETGRKLMKRALSSEKRAVRLIGIGAAELVEAGRQLEMLDNSAQRQEQLDRTIDRIRRKYGFTAIQTGRTLKLKDVFKGGGEGYELPTPGLSR
jgi:DNA polymerase-4